MRTENIRTDRLGPDDPFEYFIFGLHYFRSSFTSVLIHFISTFLSPWRKKCRNLLNLVLIRLHALTQFDPDIVESLNSLAQFR